VRERKKEEKRQREAGKKETKKGNEGRKKLNMYIG
jgi:hypothetical protein